MFNKIVVVLALTFIPAHAFAGGWFTCTIHESSGLRGQFMLRKGGAEITVAGDPAKCGADGELMWTGTSPEFPGYFGFGGNVFLSADLANDNINSITGGDFILDCTMPPITGHCVPCPAGLDEHSGSCATRQENVGNK